MKVEELVFGVHQIIARSMFGMSTRRVCIWFCQVCDSPLVEMLHEAENSEAATIECSEDEEWIENIGRALVSCGKCFGSW